MVCYYGYILADSNTPTNSFTVSGSSSGLGGHTAGPQCLQGLKAQAGTFHQPLLSLLTRALTKPFWHIISRACRGLLVPERQKKTEKQREPLSTVHDAFCVYSHVTATWLMVRVGPCLRCWKHSERAFWRVGFSGVECRFSLRIGWHSSTAILIPFLRYNNHLILKRRGGHRCHSLAQRES